MVDAAASLHEQMAASERDKRLHHASRYERRTAKLPRLGDGATRSTNSAIRDVIYVKTPESTSPWWRRNKPVPSLTHG